MNHFGLWIVDLIIHFAFWFRYRIKVEGLDKVKAMMKEKPGGILFIPNHVAVLIDPLMTAIKLWPIEARPLIVDYMYKIPVFNTVLTMQNALAVPNVDDPKVRVSRADIDALNEEIIKGLKRGDNFQIYPAGRLKNSNMEVIGGASMVHSIIQKYPCNVVLVRVKGLWGSSFSKAYTGKVTPDIGATLLNGIKHCLKNLLFFTPRRTVIVEFEPAPADFPYHADRRTFNEYLERWYNRPDGLTEQKGDYPGESLVKVSLSMWGEVYPEQKSKKSEEKLANKVSPEVTASVKARLSQVSGVDVNKINPEQALGCDLGMDSIELVEVVVGLQKDYGIKEFPYHDIVTVNELLVRTETLKN